MQSTPYRVIAVLIVLTAGCAGRQPKPIVVSSASATGYALGYAEQVDAEASALVEDKKRTGELLQSLKTGRELKPGADQQLVLAIVAQADEAGRGAAFASANAQARDLRAFWDEERGPITARVNGVAQKQLKEANCTADVSNGVGYALKDGVDKQLEKRLREQNEAQRTIEFNKALLGEGNVIAMQTLADDVATASYLVNSGLVGDRDRLQGLLAEQNDVDSTLGESIESERALQGQVKPGSAEHKASTERLAALEQSRRAIPPAVANGNAALKDVDPYIEQARTEYQTTFEALNNKLRTQTTPATARAKP